MKEKIKEIQNYFVSKIENGDFEVKTFVENGAKIEIDGEYQFSFCGIDEELIQMDVVNFIELPKILGCRILISIIKANDRELKIIELEKLQEEIENL